jgi:antiviral helicase SLH1
MSYYYLSHKTIRHLVKHAKAKASFSDVLTWMSGATEYDELPVRHNEDLINGELSRNLPFAGDHFALPMWDPHVKSFLLLQAHMSRIDLPITDYVGDQTSVLDQAIRVIQASIDVLTELNMLSSCLEMIKLLQCIKSARWPQEPPVSILPTVDPERVKDKDSTTLAQLSSLTQNQVEGLARKLHIPQSQQARFTRATSALPNVRVKTDNVTALSLTVSLQRLNAIVERDGRIYAPKYPKPQTEGWFVIVCDVASDEVFAVKRVGWTSGPGQQSGLQGSKPTTRAVLKLPEVLSSRDGKGRKVDVLVVSDAYIGLEYRLLGVEIPALPVVDNDVAKGKASSA